MISSLLIKEKRLNARDTKGDSQIEIALFSKRRMGKRKVRLWSYKVELRKPCHWSHKRESLKLF
jgi:hypothetical protein